MGTPIGLKVNLETIKDYNINDVANDLKTYHKGRYVIGKDTVYCDKPHYHIHFWSEKIVNQDALKTFKSKNLLKKYNLQRTDKIYTGKDLPNADKFNWEGYAIKEEIYLIQGYTDDEILQIKHYAGVQKDIKKLKKVKSEDLAEKDKEKKQFKDKLFDYMEKEFRKFARDNWNEISYNFPDYESPEEIKDDDFFVLKLMIVQFLMDNDKYGSIRRIFIDNYLKEYLGKVKKKSPIFIFKFFV